MWMLFRTTVRAQKKPTSTECNLASSPDKHLTTVTTSSLEKGGCAVTYRATRSVEGGDLGS